MKKVLAFLNPLQLEQKPLPHHLATVVSALLLLAAGAGFGARTALVNAGYPLGVDISTVGQPNLTQSWFNNAAAGGVQFFLVKAGGDDVGEYEDYRFPSYLAWARATGKHVGTYFFARPGADSPQTQAAHYAAILNANGGVRTGEATMDDLETTGGYSSLAWFATGFDGTIQADEGVKPLLYSYESFFKTYGLAGNASVAGGSFLNDANWYFGAPPNPIPSWSQLEVWQFSDSGCTAGVCPVDQDYQVAGWPGKAALKTSPTPAPVTAEYRREVFWNSTDGYTLDGFGGVHRFGAAPVPAGVPSWPGWNIARDIAVTSGPVGGVILDGYGGLHPIGIGGAAPAISGGPGWPGWDIARAVEFGAQGGYVLDGFGGLHPLDVDGVAAPAPAGAAYWPGFDIARDLVLIPGTDAGYVLDGYGGIHPFNGAPAVSGYAYWPGFDIARSIALNADGKSGYVLDGYGGVHPFAVVGGAAPTLCAYPYWPGWDVARDLEVTGTTGFVLDALGGLHAVHTC